ncbi:hypothetical protein N5923_13005 [Erwiniaceae bacterium BAC15a-03b]|uniref:Uncharacterized protein n=1 Tax=Winslowiella arboricola TaxID=2978220 RepID=A0A9J6PJA8_9GAMM|nr:hypothetical protein [Winslowiella arboricola]MCU5773692.1 hypothetical protein [Winslowiella arboricola]MCU5778409.1 hypothetical protein [Winslowiella arboricola]
MSLITQASSLITNGGSALSKLSGASDGASFMNGAQEIQGTMQKNQLDKMALDAENQRINGIADSAAQAGSAAAQVKIQY